MKKLFFVMVNSMDESMALDLESRVTRNELLRPSILSFKVLGEEEEVTSAPPDWVSACCSRLMVELRNCERPSTSNNVPERLFPIDEIESRFCCLVIEKGEAPRTASSLP